MNLTTDKKSRFTLLACMICLCSVPVLGQETEERFRPGEWDVSPFLTYVDREGDDWGLGASVTYFPIKNLGVGGSTYWTDFRGVFIDNLSGEAYFRIPVAKAVAPYAVGSLGYVFETEEWCATFGGGVDFRLFKSVSAFSDIQYRVVEHTREGVFLRLGARIAF